MSVRNLSAFFAPKSVALIGAGRKPDSVGGVIARNLVEGGFEGAVMFVNPHADELHGRRAYPDIASLPETPDLAIVATPAATVATSSANSPRAARRPSS